MKHGKIFIQIASYRDPELIPTLKDCLSKAKFPENLVFSIAWQHSADDAWDSLNEFSDDPRFKIIDIDYKESKGACWARNRLQQEYDDEEYTLQLDSHHRFVEGWDTELIAMHRHLKSNGHEKPLITSYVSSYNPKNDPAERAMYPYKMNFDKFIPEGSVSFLPAAIESHETLTEPIPARFYSAHFAFTTGRFVKEVPHDPELYFHGEEISITVRAYTWGYDLFHPHKLILWHEYTRSNRTKHWDDDAEWWKKNSSSFLRIRKLFEMDGLSKDIDFGVHDFGPKRTLADYERYAGISFKRRSATKYTLAHSVPPNPNPEADYEEVVSTVFKHCIDLQKSRFIKTDKTDANDYAFWAIIYEDADGVSLHRRDCNEHDVRGLLNSPDTVIHLQDEFQATKKPFKWIVWPHSKTKGWLEKIENPL
jgi:glycosyltransferase involved in cell wall biosynthesis